jgi:hypothetical protein
LSVASAFRDGLADFRFSVAQSNLDECFIKRFNEDPTSKATSFTPSGKNLMPFHWCEFD